MSPEMKKKRRAKAQKFKDIREKRRDELQLPTRVRNGKGLRIHTPKGPGRVLPEASDEAAVEGVPEGGTIGVP